MDWECEIGACLKNDVYQISENESEKYIGGYFLANDVSARDFQLEKSGQFIIGKSAPSFGPIGPFLVTPEEIARCWNGGPKGIYKPATVAYWNKVKNHLDS